ncbi:FecCD family ABC transporter permease [Micromonospora tulbaghiae]|uniref:FecCD family ABC transporter permease n=1 Tax=Micromonospora tulbaghiae TaxID=479978 RepID=UPI00340BFCD1
MSTVTLRAGRFLVRIERRTAVASAGLVTAAAALALLALSHGPQWATPAEVFDALLRGGDAGFVIREWRLPRVAAALIFGASLGLAGAVFQNLTRNALGSPDVIGLDAGAYTGALVAITLLNGTAGQLAAGSVAGGLLAAALIYLLSLDSGLSGVRLVVIGIAVNAMLTALNSWIVLRAEIDVALAATGWNAGSLNGVDWAEVRLPFAVIGLFVLLLAVISHAMHQAALGDEIARTTGVPLGRLRLLLVLAGVGCTATVTAVAGPVVFIALAAPQIGRRLARAAGVPLVPAALTGAVLLLAADLVAQMLLAPVALPVGVVTTAIGGCYLIWLLGMEVKRR